MRLTALLRSAAAAYPGGLARLALYWDFGRGRPRQGSGDVLAEFLVRELAENFVTESTSVAQLRSATEKVERAARELSAVAAHLRRQADTEGSRSGGTNVIRADFSRQDPEEV